MGTRTINIKANITDEKRTQTDTRPRKSTLTITVESYHRVNLERLQNIVMDTIAEHMAQF